ncbi:MAG: OmpA family protein [Wolinella sp.]
MAIEKKCPPCDCKPGLPLWLGTFGDLMSLLLTFFILLLSMANFDAKKLTEAEGSIQGALSILPGGLKTDPGKNRVQQLAEITFTTETAEEVNRVESLFMEFQEMAKVAEGPSSALGEETEGFILRLPAALLFKDDGVEIESEEGRLFIKRMTEVMKKLPKDVHAEVRGHTDIFPIPRNARFQDKFELTAKRALTVSKILTQEGIDPTRLITLGRGDQDPLTYTRTLEAQEQNRRVDIYLYPKRLKTLEPGNILDTTIKEH